MTQTATATRTYNDFQTVEQVREHLAGMNVKNHETLTAEMNIMIDTDESGKVDLVVAIDDNLLKLSKEGLKSLGRFAGVKKSVFTEYVDDLELTQQMIQHSLKKRSSKVVMRYDQTQVYDIYLADQPRLDPLELYDMLSARPEIERCERISTNDGAFEFRFLTTENAAPPKRVGEPSHAGLFASLNGRVELAPYVCTLSCTNGMRSERRYPRKVVSMEDLQEKVSVMVEATILQSQTLLGQLMRLDDITVKSGPAFLGRSAHDYGLPAKLRARLNDMYAELGDEPTAYDLVQYVTKQAHETNNDRFQDFGCYLTQSFVDENRCQKCGTHLDN